MASTWILPPSLLSEVPAGFSAEAAAVMEQLADVKVRFGGSGDSRRIYGVAKLLDPRFRDMPLKWFSGADDWSELAAQLGDVRAQESSDAASSSGVSRTPPWAFERLSVADFFGLKEAAASRPLEEDALAVYRAMPPLAPDGHVPFISIHFLGGLNGTCRRLSIDLVA